MRASDLKDKFGLKAVVCGGGLELFDECAAVCEAIPVACGRNDNDV